MTSAEKAVQWLCNSEAQVSAHYVIAPDGPVWQLVRDEDRAWHAGVSSWQGLTDMNSWSIGIELSNSGFHPFGEPQMNALEALLDGLMARWSIPPAQVIGHSDIAPGRKIDPGARFDWARLVRGRRAMAPAPCTASAPDPQQFRSLAQTAGYTADVSDPVLLSAVRLRHAPWRSGPLCAADMAVVGGLCRALGVVPHGPLA